ncbi:hypothetical protein B2G69_08195 [Methylorubrum zatmanii]|nr:hypothetical protein [Methylorubrum zatmanii]ARO54129.1 hypothetical protein B2G69_08195 [Methylorubrum zatmanii]
MRTVNLNLDDNLYFENVCIDVATGVAKMEGVEGGYVRLIHVMAAREYTVPLAYETTAEDALRLASAVIEWDTGMMEQADAPFSSKGPALAARQTIRSFLPRMYRCEFRDLFVDTYGYAGELR